MGRPLAPAPWPRTWTLGSSRILTGQAGTSRLGTGILEAKEENGDVPNTTARDHPSATSGLPGPRLERVVPLSSRPEAHPWSGLCGPKALWLGFLT